MPHLKSFREYVEALDTLGEIQRVDVEVDPHLEMGAITRRVYETRSPAPFFTSIKGIEPGFRALGAPVGLSARPGHQLVRIALSLGLPPDTRASTIVDALATAQTRPHIPPRIVETGPCKENVWVGEDIDINRFPAPLAHMGDGGRYLGTFGIIVARMPDGSWTNWSVARIMIVDRDRMTGIVSSTQHLGMIHDAWAKIGKPMPFAVAIGVQPAAAFVGGMPLPDNVDEGGYIGAFMGEPVDVVKCETVDLEVPATAEIVIEGTLSIERETPEGPMGEYAGYVPLGGPSLQPVYRISAVTHRDDPILPVAVAGEPVEENHTVWGVGAVGDALHILRQAGIPVTTAWAPFEAALHLLAVTVPSDWRSRSGMSGDAFCRKIGQTLFSTKSCQVIPRIIVIGDDIDPSDIDELIWGFATRCHPGSGEIFFPSEGVIPLAGFLKSSEKKTAVTSKTVYNCLPPEEWGDDLPKRSSFEHNYPRDVREKVLARWESYGFREPGAPSAVGKS